jgi:hypothetical protein
LTPPATPAYCDATLAGSRGDRGRPGRTERDRVASSAEATMAESTPCATWREVPPQIAAGDRLLDRLPTFARHRTRRRDGAHA